MAQGASGANHQRNRSSDMRLKGKVVLVTGGSMGIGEAACELMAREGAKVAVTDVDASRGEAVVSRINECGGKAGFWNLDVAHEEQVREVFADVRQRFGPISVLVNNAGIAG